MNCLYFFFIKSRFRFKGRTFSNFWVVFLEKLKTPNFHSEITWPLSFISFFLLAVHWQRKSKQKSCITSLHSIHDTVYTPTLKCLPPLNFQDLVILSFIAWTHCVVVCTLLFILDLVYILNQILRSMLKSSTQSI